MGQSEIEGPLVPSENTMTNIIYLVALLLTLRAVQAQQNTAIDFSAGVEEADGTLCVFRPEEQESLEQEQQQQCTQQNVTQCYNTYVTKYTTSVREKCEEVFVKTCRIVQRSQAYNHTVRMCKRPLVKDCNTYQTSLPIYNTGYAAPGYGAPPPPAPPPALVCRDLTETVCNTSTLTGPEGSARLPVTQCGLEERQICAEDHCQVVEGEPECYERTVENIVEVPEETCSLEPTTECKNETISIPNLIPEEKCRSVPKEVCQWVFLNPKTVKKTELVKYCLNTETGLVRPTTGIINDDIPLAINPRGSSNSNVLERQLAREQARPSNNVNTGGFRSVDVDFNNLPRELRNSN